MKQTITTIILGEIIRMGRGDQRREKGYVPVGHGTTSTTDIVATCGVVQLNLRHRQVQVMSTLPLKAISRVWGRFNELQIPYYLRVPGFKLYSWIFGVK